MKNQKARKVLAANLKYLMENSPSYSSQPKLAAKSGIGQTTIGRILRKEVDAGLDTIEQLAGVFRLTASQLMDPSLAGMVNEQSGGYITDNNVLPGPEHNGKLPLISFVQAGELCHAEDPYPVGEAEDWLSCPFPTSENAYLLRVSGPSMLPDYRDGEIIAVDPAEEAMHGDDVIARTPEGKATFKRLQITPDGTYLIALNPDWPDRVVKVPSGTEICGVVIGSWIDRKRR